MPDWPKCRMYPALECACRGASMDNPSSGSCIRERTRDFTPLVTYTSPPAAPAQSQRGEAMTTFLHDAGLCAQNSVDADGLTEATTQLTRIAGILGLPAELNPTPQEIADAVAEAVTPGLGKPDGNTCDPRETLAALWFEHAHPEVGWSNANDWWRDKAVAFAESALPPVIRLAEEIRQGERERIAQAIEADAAGTVHPSPYNSALRRAARIARDSNDSEAHR